MQIRDEGKKLKEQQAKGGCPYVVAYHGYAEFCNKITSGAFPESKPTGYER